MALLMMRWFRTLAFIGIGASLVQWYINSKNYTFSPKEVKRIAELHVNQHPSESAFKISNNLRRKYHPHIVPDSEQIWHSGYAGGLSFKFLILHASWSEQLVVFGSPLRMAGSLGSHWFNESCSVLTGSIQAFRSGSLQLREEYSPGEHMRHGMGESLYIQSGEETWCLCYARGFIPASFPLYLASNVVGGGDVVAPSKALLSALTSVTREMGYAISESLQMFMRKFGLAN